MNSTPSPPSNFIPLAKEKTNFPLEIEPNSIAVHQHPSLKLTSKITIDGQSYIDGRHIINRRDA